MIFTLAGRPQSFRSTEGFGDSEIAVGNDTPKWRFMKKQLMTAMKQHGDGLKHLEAMTLQYGDEMMQKMEEYKDGAFDPARLIVRAMASVMLTLIYGHTTEDDAKKHIRNDEQQNKVFQSTGAYMMLDILPISRFILPSVKKAYAEFMMVMNDARML